MKGIIGFAFFLLFLAGIAFVTMQGKQMAQIGAPGGGAEVTGIKWRPVMVGEEAIPKDSGMHIQFEVDGSITGHGGCNGFFGSLEQTESGIGVGPLGATRMACAETIMNREMSFLDAVQKTASFDKAGDKMKLLDVESRILAEFIDDSEN